jgi:hypothetical protein
VNAEAMFSSASQEWRTPPEFLKIVREFDDIALDPATSADNPTGAAQWLTSQEDGLKAWPLRPNSGLAFCNPPYGRALQSWAYRFHQAGGKGIELITLTPARTDAKWFQNHMTTADAWCFLRGRLKFHQQTADGTWGPLAAAPFPCLVSYWGRRASKFHKVFAPHGWTR